MTLKIPKKLRQLEKFLYSDAVSEDALLLSELDGFIAGIAVCPALIMPSEWIPVIWAGEEPVFENEAQAQNIMSILMGYYNDVIHALDKSKYMPIYDRDNDGSLFWEIWLEGLFRAIHMRADEWLSFANNDDRNLQKSIFILTRLREIVSADDDFEIMDIDAGLEVSMVNQLFPSLTNVTQSPSFRIHSSSLPSIVLSPVGRTRMRVAVADDNLTVQEQPAILAASRKVTENPTGLVGVQI